LTILHGRPSPYPAGPGRIVISSGLLRDLDAGQRRAVLAHERAHLAHRHHLHHTIAHLAAAANPLLYRLPAAVALSTERWADEAAAKCRRDTVADALIHTALGGTQLLTAPALVLAAATEVVARVHAVRGPAPRLALWRVALLFALLVATAAPVLEAAQDTERIFELAQAAYRTGHH
jgi:beta-lactamase regulating signal transducer with metallopeptidase domain